MKLFVSLFLGSILVFEVAGQPLQSAVQTYFVPLPEPELFLSFEAINTGTAGKVNNLISIAIAADNTFVYYDHHEDGYDNTFITDVSTRQISTEIWGDNNIANGHPPNMPSDPALMGGDTIVLISAVPVAGRNFTADGQFYYDGKDRIQATLPIAVTRSGYPDSPGSLMAGAVEVLNVDSWGNNFIAPVGNNSGTTAITTDPFTYSVFYVMAGFPNTKVTFPGGQTVLGIGDNLVLSIEEGDTIVSDRPVQVDLVAGDVGSDYELRWYAQVDSTEWSNEYLSPVAESTSGTAFWFYNPNAAALTVNFEGGNINNDPGSFIIGGMQSKLVVASASSTSEIVLGTDDVEGGTRYSGVRFFANDVFYGLVQIDHGIGSGGGRIYDWGFPLIPTFQLTSQALVGLGYGCTNNVCDNNNGERSVVWVTPIADTIIFVDYDGDGLFEDTFNLNALNSLRLTNPNSADMTGAIIASSPVNVNGLPGTPVKMAVAWGQDPRRSRANDPLGLDLGTAVVPVANPFVSKQVVGVQNPDGSQDFNLLVDQEGDIIQYEITVSNVGFTALTNIEVVDILIADTLTGPVESFQPFDGVLQKGETFVYFGNYTVVESDITTLGGGDGKIQNTATVSADTIPGISVMTETPIFLVNISGTVYEDINGDNAGEVPIEGVLITLVNDNSIVIMSTLTIEGGVYTFADLQAGNYTVIEHNLNISYTDVGDTDGGDPNSIALDGLVGGPEYTGNAFIDERLGCISGTVKDEVNNPIANVNITLTNLLINVSISTLTDSEGEYELDMLRPGNYTVVQANLPAYPTSMSDEDSIFDGDVGDNDKTVDDLILVTLLPGENCDDGNDFVDILGSQTPSMTPSITPSRKPSYVPSSEPSLSPSARPSSMDSGSPSVIRSNFPSFFPSLDPSVSPSDKPSGSPITARSKMPSSSPSMRPSLVESAWPSFAPTMTPSHTPTLMPIFKAPPSPENCCRGIDVGDCDVCVPFRSLDYCPRDQSFPALIGERTRAFRNNATAVESDGYWFHYLEDKIAGYLLSVAEGMPVPEIYCCVTNVSDLDMECLNTTNIPATQRNIVIKATSFHSSQGIYVLKNFSIDVINNPTVPYMYELIKGMATSYSDVISELSALLTTKIIVEEFIGDDLPTEYKFHVVNGTIAAIDLIVDRGGECACYAVIDTDGRRLDNFGCFEPGGVEMVNDNCAAIDFVSGQMNCGPVKRDLFICDELPALDKCLLDDMGKAALQLAGAIGVYMRVDMFVVDGKFYVQEYAANHMNGLRHCAAKVTDNCVDSCFLGRLWNNAGAPYGGGPAVTPPSKLDPAIVGNFRLLSADAQCALLDGVTVPVYDYNEACSVFPTIPPTASPAPTQPRPGFLPPG